ncbi:hypothetical protein PENTCL1PPCAC_787, partial [Pristionchus entomophagus]
AMSYELAREKLFSVAMELDGESLDDKLNLRFARSLQVAPCGPCRNTFDQHDMMTHFLSKKHRKKMIVLSAAVSRAAFEYWADKLQHESAAAAAVPA